MKNRQLKKNIKKRIKLLNYALKNFDSRKHVHIEKSRRQGLTLSFLKILKLENERTDLKRKLIRMQDFKREKSRKAFEMIYFSKFNRSLTTRKNWYEKEKKKMKDFNIKRELTLEYIDEEAILEATDSLINKDANSLTAIENLYSTLLKD